MKLKGFIYSYLFFTSLAARANSIFTEKLLEFGSCQLHIRKSGNPSSLAPLVMINGVPTTSLIYQNLTQELAELTLREIIAVDLPGTGKSRNKTYTWTQSEQCLQSYLKSLDKDFLLLVHDIAGPVILPLLTDKSLKIAGVVILNTILKPDAFQPVFPMSLVRTPVVGAVAAPLLPFFYFSKEFRSKGIARNDDISREDLKELYKDFSKGCGKFRFHRVMRGFELDSLRTRRVKDGLATHTPKLVIWGLSDPSLGSQYSHVALVKNAQVKTYKEAKHFLMLDYANEIAHDIHAWLRSSKL